MTALNCILKWDQIPFARRLKTHESWIYRPRKCWRQTGRQPFAQRLWIFTVRDLDKDVAQKFLDGGAHWADSPKEMAEACDLIITCLPSPAASAAVMEAEDGILAGLSEGKIWAEMSTTDEAEVKRLGALVKAKGAEPVDCPVSGGCHRAATGNIAIFRRLRTGNV